MIDKLEPSPKPRYLELLDHFGAILVTLFHKLALFVIGAVLVWSAADACLEMFEAGRATLDDILLLFIYLELGAMLGIYFKTSRLPVRFLMYVAVTALTRHLTIDMNELTDLNMLAISGAILLLALAVLVFRFSSARFRTENDGLI